MNPESQERRICERRGRNHPAGNEDMPRSESHPEKRKVPDRRRGDESIDAKIRKIERDLKALKSRYFTEDA